MQNTQSQSGADFWDNEPVQPVQPIHAYNPDPPYYRVLQRPPEPKPVYRTQDTVFSLIAIAVGFIIVKLFFTGSSVYDFGAVMVSGWYHVITAFCGVAALFYIGKKPVVGQWLIFGCAMLFCAVPFFATSAPVRFLSWVYAAVLLCYFAYSFSSGAKMLADGFVLHLCAAVFAVPVLNFTAAPAAVFSPIKNRKSKSRMPLYILLGLLSSLPVTLIAAAFLSSADDNFGRAVAKIFSGFGDNFFQNLLIFAFSLPLSFLLFGILRGAKSRRKTLTCDTGCAARAPAAAVCAALAPIILLYLLFFLCQIPYFTGAFGGTLPEGYSYSEYARQGFFELCAVTVINLVVIILSHLFAKASENGEKPASVRAFSVVFCLLTLSLIASALSKMFLYISEYGLTRLRFYTSWFMILLAAVFIVVIIRKLIPRLPGVKVLFAVFTVCLAALCFCDPDARVAQYNVESYLSGQTDSIDKESLYDLSESALPYIEQLPLTESEKAEVQMKFEERKKQEMYFGKVF